MLRCSEGRANLKLDEAAAGRTNDDRMKPAVVVSVEGPTLSDGIAAYDVRWSTHAGQTGRGLTINDLLKRASERRTVYANPVE